MPNHNLGLPTNSQMQFEWAERSLHIYRTVLGGIVRALTDYPSQVAWLQGKPLNTVQVAFLHEPLETSSAFSKIVRQSLIIGVRNLDDESGYTRVPGLTAEDADPIRENITRIGRRVLEQGFDIETVNDPNVIGAEYEATYRSEQDRRGREYTPVRSSSTFYGRPAKMHLALAKGFSDEVEPYVESEVFQRFPLGLSRNALLHRFVVPVGFAMGHVVGLRMVPGLPLNGHEPSEFLVPYCNSMQKQRISAGRTTTAMRKRQSEGGVVRDGLAYYEAREQNYADSENASRQILYNRLFGSSKT